MSLKNNDGAALRPNSGTESKSTVDTGREKFLGSPGGLDETVARQTTDGVKSSGASSESERIVVRQRPFPQSLLEHFELVRDPNDDVFVIMRDAGNLYAVRVDSDVVKNKIRALGRDAGKVLRRADLNDLVAELKSHAIETKVAVRDIAYRVAKVTDGVEIDLGDDEHTHVRITTDGVEIIMEGSEILFYRTAVSRSFPMPAETGDVKRLKKHLNLEDAHKLLLLGWITFTLAHPKSRETNYIHLVLQGDQGSGKSFLCHVLQSLIDPCRVGLQMLPRNPKDLAIAGNQAHVLLYDNLREIRQSMADNLCIASTGGTLSGRRLYTDSEMHVDRLHVAVVLNGIHSFIDQPDLAQRCLTLRLKTMLESKRKSETDLRNDFDKDLPSILRGLFDLIANIFKHLPDAEVSNPERMIDFTKWLAAMERVYGASPGTYQKLYSEVLRETQLDSLMEHPLAAGVLQLVEALDTETWSGTPAELLNKLDLVVSFGTQRSREWPANAIALSKRLGALKGGLLTQGIDVQFARGKHRRITITKTLEYQND